MKRLLVLGSLVGALVSVFVLATRPDVPDDLRSAAQSTPGNCEVPGDDTSTWLAGDEAQALVNKVQGILDKRFGVDTKASPYTTLEAGLVGLTHAPESRTLVVVVDVNVVEATSLEAELLSAINRDANMSVAVQGACHSSSELLKTAAWLTQRDWSKGAAEAHFSSFLNPRTSTFDVTFPSEQRNIADQLIDLAGETVRISFGASSRATRASDSQPHWGGAGIGKDGDGLGNVCSSGFTVDTVSAGKAMVTAGHCFNNGDVIESGSQAYGTAQAKSQYPTYDMMLINASNQNYDDDIYHDPIRAELNPIDVSGAGNPGIGGSLCISGMVHRAVCGNVVSSLNAQLCDPDGCTNGLIRTERSGSDPCAGGTSGGPMYAASTSATVRGLLIGNQSDANGTITSCLGEKVTNVQGHLNVTVATSP